MIRLAASLIRLCELIPFALIALLGRFAMARTFWDSGQTKLAGTAQCLREFACAKLNPFDLAPTAVALFESEYKMPFPWFTAHVCALAEFVLPALLIFGLASRFSALGLLVMTLVIEIFVYPGAYVLHGTWAAVLLMIVKFGPGKISLDQLISRR